jgi:enterobacterial common antigen flippase
MDNFGKEKSYGQILKSTTLVGGSQVVNILLGILRTKVMALLLGLDGIGLIGLYNAVTGMAGTITGLGIGSSGVRQIAEAVGSGDEKKIARTIITVRRTALILGMLGMLLTALLCKPLSQITFGNVDHAIAIALLSVTLFLGAVSSGQTALIQGMRRIADLAKLSVLGAFLGTLFSISMVFYWGKEGIVPSIVAVSTMSILTSWWFARKIPIVMLPLSWRETKSEARGLVTLGFFFMASSLMSSATNYFVRVLVVQQIGMDGVGLYQAAYTLSELYIGFVLNAMAMDFYPRLTVVAENNKACNRMVNEQTGIGLLVAAPGIVATLTFASLIMELFYSHKFIPAYNVLRWQILGMLLRVVSWPLGFIIMAKGKGKIFLWTEAVAHSTHVVLIWFGLHLFGLEGTGIAFFTLYVIYTVMILSVVQRLSGFTWSSVNLLHGITLIAFIGIAFLLPFMMSQNVALVFGSILTFVVTAYCLRALYMLVGLELLTGIIKKIRALLGWKRN